MTIEVTTEEIVELLEVIYGRKYPSMKVAIKVRDALIEDDWDLSNIQNIRDKLREDGEVL